MNGRGVAFAIAALAAAAWLAAAFLPWLDVEDSSHSLTRDDLLTSAVPYERAIAALPLATLAIGSFTLVATAGWGRLAGPPWRVHAGAVVLACGALAIVNACRMLGFVVVRALDPGDAQVFLGPAPLAVAVAGLAFAAWGWLALEKAMVGLPWSAVAAFGTLAAMPFVPFGASASGAFLYDELSIAATAASGPGVLREAGEALAWMRAALWVAAASGLVWALGPLPRLGLPRWRLAVLGPAPLAAVALCGLFLARWAAVDGLAWSWNAVAPLGALASAALVGWQPRTALPAQPDVAAGEAP